ncbi:MAG TPA: hypothetical protein VJ461_02785 [Candidatus Nanoarchaeia archaeon]|nr:hypothetical protein [Candidatus Nanoarchaeia archaeon]
MAEKSETKQGNASILKKKIKYLEEELVRKQGIIEKLKKENLILFKTALKHSEKKIDERKEN